MCWSWRLVGLRDSCLVFKSHSWAEFLGGQFLFPTKRGEKPSKRDVFLYLFYIKDKCKLSCVGMDPGWPCMIWCHKEFFKKKMANLVCVVRVSVYHFGGINAVCDSLYKFARFNSCCYGEGERSHTVIKQACCHKDMYTIARVSMSLQACQEPQLFPDSQISHNTHTYVHVIFFLP